MNRVDKLQLFENCIVLECLPGRLLEMEQCHCWDLFWVHW